MDENQKTLAEMVAETLSDVFDDAKVSIETKESAYIHEVR